MTAPNVFIFHHNDLDGRASASVAYEFYKGIYENANIKLIEVDYTIELNEDIQKDDIAVFLDYSFSSKNNVEYLTTLIENNIRVVWIDHHASSLNVLKNNSELFDACGDSKKVDIVLDTSYCGAWLSFNYFKEKYLSMKANKEVKNKYMGYVPDFIKYVNSHDLWRFDMPNTEEFVLGIESLDYAPEKLMDMVYGNFSIDLFNNKNIIRRAIAIMDKHNTECRKYIESESTFINNMIEAGKCIKRYKDRQNKIERNYSGFEFKIKYKSETKQITYRGFAMNLHGNSSVFGEKFNEYDIVCPFIRTKSGIWKYSLFTSKDGIDCSSIASALGCMDYLGGGGHVKAAGFQTKKCIFDSGNTIHVSPEKYNYKIFINTEEETIE